MNNISKYLDKFFKKIDGDEVYLSKIVEILKNKIGADVSVNDLEMKNNVLYTNLSVGFKNKVFIYKEDLIKEINSLGHKNILDIR